jgi:hypothetical protein
MIRLYCDRCHKEILNEEYCLQVNVQEQQYKGENKFVINPHCLSASRILCDPCNQFLKEFFNYTIQFN